MHHRVFDLSFILVKCRGKQEGFMGKVLTAEAWQLQFDSLDRAQMMERELILDCSLTSTCKQTMHARMWPEIFLLFL